MSSQPNKEIPNYSIDRVKGADHGPEDLMVMRFGEYLASRNYLFRPHRHTFYHLVYFTKGAGRHHIDFVHFPVEPGQIYFMCPGQVHNWELSRGADGYIVNFPPRFIQSRWSNPNYLEQFSFFSGIAKDQVIRIPAAARPGIAGIFEKILEELAGSGDRAMDMVFTLLLQLFIGVSRLNGAGQPGQAAGPGQLMLRNFRKLVDEQYIRKKLPKEYAAMLYVTPNYLNSLCRDLTGQSAGELIRERVLLEAKRLLVNAGMSIGEIAYQLDFQDNSYFTKFFKKYVGKTPEEFRKDSQVVSTHS